MDDLERLHNLVSKLRAKDITKDEQIKALQEIGRELVSNYEIKLPDGLVIQPLWVEAYYSDRDREFMDPFIHGEPEQKENFGKLYFHHKTDDSRSGVDICLSDGPYYLSFLLKYTLVNDSFTTQSQLSGKVREAYNKLSDEEKARILSKASDTANYEYVICTTRIGLDSKKEKDTIKREQKEQHEMLPLAIVRDFHKKFASLSSLPRRETLVKQYLGESDMTIAEKASFCKEHLGYCPTEYKEK